MIRWLRSLFGWRITSETWAWVHYVNDVTGEVRDVQKVRGVPMVPPPLRPANLCTICGAVHAHRAPRPQR